MAVAQVLEDDGVAARHEEIGDLGVAALPLVVGRHADDRGVAAGDELAVARRAVDVDRQADPVPHLHQHVLRDDDPVAHSFSLSMIRLPVSSTATVKPGWTTVVESNSSITAGPANDAPAGSA